MRLRDQDFRSIATERRRLIFALGAAVLLSGCQTTRGQAVARLTLPLEPPPAHLARIYIYRRDKKLFRAVEPLVVINGRSSGISRPGEAFYRDAKPGRYQVFTTADPAEVIYLEMAAGRLYYVEMEVAFAGLGIQLLPVERNATEAVAVLDGLSLVAAGT